MGFRIFVEKKAGFETAKETLLAELRTRTPIRPLGRYLIYELFGIPAAEFPAQALEMLADPVTDRLHRDLSLPPRYLAVECLPGQYDARADAALQCFQLLGLDSITAKTAVLYTFEGLSERGLQAVKRQLINPIESREKDLKKLALEPPPNPSPCPASTVFSTSTKASARPSTSAMACRWDWTIWPLSRSTFNP